MARMIGAAKSSTAASLTAGNKAASDLRAALNGSLINQGSAPGAWTLKEQFAQKKSATWAGHAEAISNAAAQPGGTLTVNTFEDLKNVYNFDDLESFLNVYNTLATTLRNKEDFTDLAFAYCQKAMSENIKHAEIFFDPQTHLSRGLSFADVVDGIQDGLEKGRVKGLNIQLICSFLRDHPVGNVTDPSPDYKSKNPGSTPTAWDTIKQCVQYNKN